MYISSYIQKKCYQHSYEFLNLMSSWRWGSKYSKSQWVGDFSIFGSKSSHIQIVILKIILAPCFLLQHHTRYKTYHTPSLRGAATQHLYHEAQMSKLFQNLCVETTFWCCGLQSRVGSTPKDSDTRGIMFSFCIVSISN